ncbi:AI-2E family transporter [Bacillus sp. B15-48]|uniref:AI-2E family transporter n=1 Tax=Bacillus sp. B15-48 TaxID=1548601 RepID=UPI00193EFC05|nr:AI-2E family transporter [Bacillus sp. B15-48]MBM4764414.1 AI-2E family transporter [Bacillus sp. B15-48]
MYNKFIKFGLAIIIVFLIIYLGTLIDWVFSPLLVFVQTLFVPIILSGVLFYIFRPIVRLLSKKIPRTLAILLLYFGFTALIVGLLALIVPELQTQFYSLLNSIPMIISEIQLLLIQLQQYELVQRFDLTDLFGWEDEINQVGTIINNLFREITTNTLSFLGAVFNILILIFVVPFILFYLLKEGEKLPKRVVRFTKKEKQEEVRLIISDMDTMISNYIQGVLIVCSFIGILCYTAFTIIGLDYALILALFAMVTNVIPYVGPWIGAVPSVIVGMLHSPLMALLVIAIVVIVQQIESIFIQPQVMGKKLSMHPVTVLFLVLVAGRFAGILGMVLAIPTYAIGKVIVTHIYRLWKLKQVEEKLDAS